MAKHLKKHKNKTIITIFQIIFLAMLVISLIEIVKWFKENNENQKLIEELSESITIDEKQQVEENTLKCSVNFEKLKEKNSDTIAWLKVQGVDIEYPVVKSNDNSYYLNHNFEKEYNKAGWIFADYRNKFDGTDKNIIIYGHNRKDGSMFGNLKNILKEEWYNNEENRKVIFITENEKSIYEVFSVYQIENEDYYITTDFTDGQFESFIKTIKKRSIKNFNIEVKEKDNILTLSTCADNNKYRVVLHAKK